MWSPDNLYRSMAFIGVLALSGHVWAADPAKAASSQSQILADFETSSSLNVWNGLPHRQDAEHHSSGAYGMAFDIPQWKEGDEPRPGVVLPLGDPGGPACADLSDWGGIAVDVWVTGGTPGKLGLKLRDESGENSWTTHITVEPGRMNTAALTMIDARADCDIRKAREVVLYALRPENAFTLVVDNLRLLPKDVPAALCEFSLRYPNYRNMIFPEGGDVAVNIHTALDEHGLSPREVEWKISASADRRNVSRTARLHADQAELEVPVEALPCGEIKIRAALMKRAGGAELAVREWNVRKITPEEAAALRVYYDRRNVLHVNGKPFFPLGWYGSANAEQLAEVSGGPFNCMLWYGTNHVSKAKMLELLDDVRQRGMKLIYCMNDVYPTAKYFDGKTWEGVTGNEAIADAAIQAYKDHPAVLAWYLNDELPRDLKPDLIKYYERIQAADPSRPAFIVLCNRRDLPVFPETTDILGVDPYPIPNESLLRVSGFVDAGRDAVDDAKPVWLVPQAFAWYQYNSKNPDRGHAPTPEELKTGRAPTEEEERCMTWLGVTHGATALIYYCYYDFRVLPQHAEMWPWMKNIAQEVADFSPVLLEGEDLPAPGIEPAQGMHARLLRYQEHLYLIAVNSGRKPATATFCFSGRMPYSGQVILGGTQSIRIRGRRLNDSFAPLQVKIYRFGPE